MEIAKMKNFTKIPGYSNYLVSRDGRVKTTLYDGRFMKPGTDRNGYQRIYMYGDDGKRKGVYLHQIMAQVFLSNSKNKPHVNHIDNNPKNNKLENLEWCTPKENRNHAAKQGRLPSLQGATNGHSKYSNELVLALRRLYATGKYTQMQLAKRFNMPFPTIHVIVKRKQWRNI